MQTARANYRQFIADGLAMGQRPEFVGGGLRRSQGGEFLPGNVESFDDRVLGSGDFVDELLGEPPLDKGLRKRMSMDSLKEEILACYDLTNDQFKRRGRYNLVSDARALFCYLAVEELQVTGMDVVRFLDIGSSSVSRSVRRGEELYGAQLNLQAWWKALKQ